MEGEVQAVFFLLGKPVTAYALLLTASLAVGLALTAMRWNKAGLVPGGASVLALWTLPLGLLGARLFYCLARISYYLEIGLENVFRLWDGGYALWGAAGGVAVAAVITAKTQRLSLPVVLDTLAPPAALTIALCRFAECFSGEGIGLLVENELFCRFPFALCNEWGEWYWAICILEGLAACVIFGLLLRRQRAPGNTVRLFLILYSAAQVLFESLRRDNFLRWLFVRVSQLTAVLVLVALMLAGLIRWARKPRKERCSLGRMLGYWLFFAACVGICILLEFAIDKSPVLPIWAAYCIMSVCCVGLGWSAYQVVLKE